MSLKLNFTFMVHQDTCSKLQQLLISSFSGFFSPTDRHKRTHAVKNNTCVYDVTL